MISAPLTEQDSIFLIAEASKFKPKKLDGKVVITYGGRDHLYNPYKNSGEAFMLIPQFNLQLSVNDERAICVTLDGLVFSEPVEPSAFQAARNVLCKAVVFLTTRDRACLEQDND